ncbi:MAG TPA: flavodoxin family protein [Chloroflexi bacterium]|nr:flavodoxin family protein [Chloroflexota bacterium]
MNMLIIYDSAFGNTEKVAQAMGAALGCEARLIKKGGIRAMPSAGFFVEGEKGPLRDGELERAADWARRILAPSA